MSTQVVGNKELEIHSDRLPESAHHLEHDIHVRTMTPAQMKATQIRGMLSIFGGVLLQFCFGTFYSWGTISPYVTAYLKQYDSSINLLQMAMVFPFLGLATNACLSFGLKIAEKIGYKTTIFICGMLVALAFLLESFITNYGAFVAIYCSLFGIPSGTAYMVPVICGWKFFPHRKGMISGFLVGAYGFGSFIFNFVCLAIVNPKNAKPNIEFLEDGTVHKYFGPEVYQNVPKMFQVLSGIFFVLAILATILITYPRDFQPDYIQVAQTNKTNQDVPHSSTEGAVQNLNQCQSLTQGLKSLPFIIMAPLVLTASVFGLFMSNCYKFYGLQMGIDDYMLTIIGSIASATNGCSRYFWAMAFDRWGFKRLTRINLLIQAGMAAGMGYLNGSSAGLLIMDAMTLGCMGGIFSTYPVLCTKIFGQKVGPVIYGVFFFIIGVSNMVAYLIYRFAIVDIGFEGLFWIFFALLILAQVLNHFVPETGYNWNK